jgi:hypothetical protein
MATWDRAMRRAADLACGVETDDDDDQVDDDETE